jgi:hypothetical protein
VICASSPSSRHCRDAPPFAGTPAEPLALSRPEDTSTWVDASILIDESCRGHGQPSTGRRRTCRAGCPAGSEASELSDDHVGRVGAGVVVDPGRRTRRRRMVQGRRTGDRFGRPVVMNADVSTASASARLSWVCPAHRRRAVRHDRRGPVSPTRPPPPGILVDGNAHPARSDCSTSDQPVRCWLRMHLRDSRLSTSTRPPCTYQTVTRSVVASWTPPPLPSGTLCYGSRFAAARSLAWGSDDGHSERHEGRGRRCRQ